MEAQLLHVENERDAALVRAEYAEGEMARLAAELRKLQREIEDLTPGGSEFCGDTGRCLDWIHEALSGVAHLAGERNHFRDALAALRVQFDDEQEKALSYGQQMEIGWQERNAFEAQLQGQALGLEPIEYQLDYDPHLYIDVRLTNRRNAPGQPDRWAIMEGGQCYGKDGDWELERQPSSRSDEFLQRCRFASAVEALTFWRTSGGKSVVRRCVERRRQMGLEEDTEE